MIKASPWPIAQASLRDVRVDALVQFAQIALPLSCATLAASGNALKVWHAFVIEDVHPLYCERCAPVHLTPNVMLKVARELKWYYETKIRELREYEEENLNWERENDYGL